LRLLSLYAQCRQMCSGSVPAVLRYLLHVRTQTREIRRIDPAAAGDKPPPFLAPPRRPRFIASTCDEIRRSQNALGKRLNTGAALVGLILTVGLRARAVRQRKRRGSPLDRWVREQIDLYLACSLFGFWFTHTFLQRLAQLLLHGGIRHGTAAYSTMRKGTARLLRTSSLRFGLSVSEFGMLQCYLHLPLRLHSLVRYILCSRMRLVLCRLGHRSLLLRLGCLEEAAL
jgi:hypothetical protein